MTKQSKSHVNNFGLLRSYLAEYTPRLRDLVFDYDADFLHIRGYLISEQDGCLFAGHPRERKELSDFKKLAPAIFTIIPEVKPRCYPQFMSVWKNITQILVAGRRTENEIIKFCTTSSDVPNDISTFVLKAAVAAGFVKPVKAKKTLRFELAEIEQDHLGRDKYRFSISDELKILHDRLELLVNHMPTIGSYKETLLRSFLSKYLPDRYHPATGFMLGDYYSPKGQIDILVYDKQDSVPVFREGDLVVMSIAGVRAAIEVKSRLTSTELDSSLLLLDNNIRREVTVQPLFKGIYAFDGTLTPTTIAKHIRDYYNGYDSSPVGPISRELSHHFQVVDAIAISNRTCVICQPVLDGGAAEMIAIEGDEGDPFTAAFLTCLLGFLNIPKGQKRMMLDSFGHNRWKVTSLGMIHGDGWKQRSFSSARPKDPEGIKKYIKSVMAWREGILDWTWN